MKAAIVLVMHGMPPRDFPKHELAEFFHLHAQLHDADTAQRRVLQHRHAELDAKMRAWPRSDQNDPFYIGSQEVASHLRRATGCEVIVGFNEFCNPSLDDALEQAATQTPEKVIVVTPMMMRGGEHSEVDIPTAIRSARARHPKIPIVYAWPFEASEIAQFLAEHIDRLVEKTSILPRSEAAQGPAQTAASSPLGDPQRVR